MGMAEFFLKIYDRFSRHRTATAIAILILMVLCVISKS